MLIQSKNNTMTYTDIFSEDHTSHVVDTFESAMDELDSQATESVASTFEAEVERRERDIAAMRTDEVAPSMDYRKSNRRRKVSARAQSWSADIKDEDDEMNDQFDKKYSWLSSKRAKRAHDYSATNGGSSPKRLPAVGKRVKGVVYAVDDGKCQRWSGKRLDWMCENMDDGRCYKLAQGNTPFCKGHGGGARCVAPDCDRAARSGSEQLCASHGGGLRCNFPGCKRRSVNHKLCKRHQAEEELEEGKEVVKVFIKERKQSKESKLIVKQSKPKIKRSKHDKLQKNGKISKQGKTYKLGTLAEQKKLSNKEGKRSKQGKFSKRVKLAKDGTKLDKNDKLKKKKKEMKRTSKTGKERSSKSRKTDSILKPSAGMEHVPQPLDPSWLTHAQAAQALILQCVGMMTLIRSTR